LDQDPLILETFVLCMNTEGEYSKYKEAKDKQKQEMENKRKKRGKR